MTTTPVLFYLFEQCAISQMISDNGERKSNGRLR